jgi:hypothetical protein
MGRGRAKAKQQKVARELKYSTHDTDLTALQRELSSYGPAPSAPVVEDDDEDESDEYGGWAGAAR